MKQQFPSCPKSTLKELQASVKEKIISLPDTNVTYWSEVERPRDTEKVVLTRPPKGESMKTYSVSDDGELILEEKRNSTLLFYAYDKDDTFKLHSTTFVKGLYSNLFQSLFCDDVDVFYFNTSEDESVSFINLLRP